MIITGPGHDHARGMMRVMIHTSDSQARRPRPRRRCVRQGLLEQVEPERPSLRKQQRRCSTRTLLARPLRRALR